MLYYIHSEILKIFVLINSCVEPKGVVDSTTEEKKIRELNQTLFRAEEQRDLDAVMRCLAPDVVFHPPNEGALSGAVAIQGFYENFFKLPYTALSGAPDTIVVSSAGELAYDMGKCQIVLETPDGQIQSNVKYLVIWRKIEEEWKCAALSWNSSDPAD
jgi:ketosteroid isomerase-like protein